MPGSPDKYLAVFNISDAAPGAPARAGARVPVRLADLGIAGATAAVPDLWSGRAPPAASGVFMPEVAFHGARLFRVGPLAARQ